VTPLAALPLTAGFFPLSAPA